MGSILDNWFGINPPKMPPPPPPEAIPETGGDKAGFLERMRRRRGRSKTLLTGDLVPEDVGKRSLLG